jgi:maltose O-acetyltransferase
LPPARPSQRDVDPSFAFASYYDYSSKKTITDNKMLPVTERQRMLKGEPYRSRDPELLGLYHRAKGLLEEYTQTRSTDAGGKQRILTGLLGHIGSGVWIESPFFCDYGVNIHIGDDCFINYNCVFLDSNLITIGNGVLIGPSVQLYTATHPLISEDRLLAGGSGYVTRALPITIGNHAWIGGGAIIMPGVGIGAHSTIGAGSVVTRDIPQRCFAAGNPCRVLREL